MDTQNPFDPIVRLLEQSKPLISSFDPRLGKVATALGGAILAFGASQGGDKKMRRARKDLKKGLKTASKSTGKLLRGMQRAIEKHPLRSAMVMGTAAALAVMEMIHEESVAKAKEREAERDDGILKPRAEKESDGDGIPATH